MTRNRFWAVVDRKTGKIGGLGEVLAIFYKKSMANSNGGKLKEYQVLPAHVVTGVCEWKIPMGERNKTSCGQETWLQFDKGRFCPFCGKPIRGVSK